VIAAGGGGIPVIERKGHLEGVEAVIDKDFASSALASSIKADILLIVTAVPAVYLYFNTPRQKPLYNISPLEAKKYLREGHFAEGSMKPKIEAAIEFLEKGGSKVIITNVENAYASLHDKNHGTVISRN
jgi:carbamate kinase